MYGRFMGIETTSIVQMTIVLKSFDTFDGFHLMAYILQSLSFFALLHIGLQHSRSVSDYILIGKQPACYLEKCSPSRSILPIFKVVAPPTVGAPNATTTTTTTVAANQEFTVERSMIGDQLVFVKSQSECERMENTVHGTDEVLCFCEESNATFHYVMDEQKIKTGCYSVNNICPGKKSIPPFKSFKSQHFQGHIYA